MYSKALFLFISVLSNFFYLVSNEETNNVCNSFQDYKTVETNPKCWYNPDIFGNPEAICTRYGYKLERHAIHTEDGYHLTLFHVVPKNSNNEYRQPLYVQHGIAVESLQFLVSGNNSLTFFLVNLGYDIWLGNSRGTRFSRAHDYLDEKDEKYWNFSFHEMAVYDIPPTIEYIANQTGNKGNIIYMGHSMGVTILSIYTSMFKEHSERYIEKAVLLCPVTYIKHMKGLFGKNAGSLHYPLKALKTIGRNNVYGRQTMEHFVEKNYCTSRNYKHCYYVLCTVTGFSKNQLRYDLLPAIFSLWPRGISLKILAHFLQIIQSKGEFRQFDYGEKKNLELYNTTLAPSYNLPSIQIPFHIIYGENDYISLKEDAYLLFTKLKMQEKTIHGIENFNHLDFFLSKHVEEQFYEYLKTVLNKPGLK